MDQGSKAALKILDRCFEQARAGAIEGAGEPGAKYLVAICSSIVRVSCLIGHLKDGVAGHPGVGPRFTYDLDVLAFGIAVDSALFFELGCGDDLASDATRGWVGLTLTAASQLLPDLEGTPARLEGIGMKNDESMDSIDSAVKVLRRLRDGLRFLCSSWVVAETLSLAAQVRTHGRPGAGHTN